MKRIAACLVAVLMIVMMLTACGSSNESGNSSESGGNTEKLKIVATIFPQYDWARQILGEEIENAELTLLLDSGVDLHSYQPTTDDIIKISSCDMFIYTGGESDAWVEDAIQTATNDDMVVINLLYVLGDAVKEEEIIEGMEHDHEHEDEESPEHEDEESHEHEDEEDHEHGELDEHVWLSLRHAQTLCSYISDRLGELDPDHADVYGANAVAYNEKLAALDGEYIEAATSAAYDTLLFGDRFPFRYLVDDYGLSYYAAFSGCSAETEASFETVVFLADKTDELGLNNVMVIETSDQSIARTVIENTTSKNQQILVLDSLQSVTSSDITSGASYLSMMESNLEVLKQALN